jgi:iron complex transport system permease protein
LRYLAAPKLVWLLALLLPTAMLSSLALGTVVIPPAEIIQTLFSYLDSSLPNSEAASPQLKSILFDIRLPRILLALLVGAVLASCGVIMQGLFRNPLADPSLIGVSGGASVGASLTIVSSASVLSASPFASLSVVAFGAFVGGFLATLLVYRVATSSLGTSVATMLLAGIAIGALSGALNSLFSYFSDNQMLRQISVWQMGNLNGANGIKVLLMALTALCFLVLLPSHTKALNALLLGESEARHLGINVQQVKRNLILLVALGVGVSVALAGLIGFVGLVVPHIVRLMIGPDHRWLLPASALAGAILLIIADCFARIVLLPAELPTGILTALIGAPFFVVLLMGQRRTL